MGLPTTIWTDLLKAQGDPEGARDRIVRRYWDPVRRYAQHKGLTPEDAEDLTQEVFAQLCRPGFLERADRSQGRFRGLLMAVTQNVLKMWRRHEHARKRRPPGGLVSLDDERLLEIADRSGADPADEVFNRFWGETVVHQALEELKQEGERLGTPYEPAVRAFYLEGRSYSQIAQQLDVEESRIKNYVHRGKARLSDLIHECIREYCRNTESCETELQELREFLGRDPGA